MKICQRPECNNILKTGKYFCSARCAAIDRWEKKRAGRQIIVSDHIPKSFANRMERELGESTAQVILAEVSKMVRDDGDVIPLPLEGSTYGDWTLSFDGKKDYRPGDDLDYEKIKKMMRSGPVNFAVEMKRSQVMRIFSYGRYEVISPDKELKEIAEANLREILPKMAYDFTYSGFVYGTSFQEEVWEWRTKYELGLSNSRNAANKFLVSTTPNSVHPETIAHIDRDSDGKFDGFSQMRLTSTKNLLSNDVVKVNREAALVIPVNGYFRRLWGKSMLYTIYPIWLWYELTMRAMVRYMERVAMPVALARAPMRGRLNVEGKDSPIRSMDMMLAVAATIAKSNAAVIPSDLDEHGKEKYGLAYLTAPERGTEFIRGLEFLSQEMVRAALSSDKSLIQGSSSAGSRALGEVHAKASALSSEMMIINFLFYLNKYFMPGYSLYNRGVNGPPIWIRVQPTDAEERDLLLKLISIASNSPAGQEFSYMVDWRSLGKMSNIPTLGEEEVKKLKGQLQEESLKKQEDNQKMMMKYQKDTSTNPQRGDFVSNPKKVAGQNAGDRQVKASDDILKAMDRGDSIGLVLSRDDLDFFIQRKSERGEQLKLFNPFHDKTGRFTSGRGGGGAGGDATARAKGRAMSKASSRPGSIVKTTGKVLGIAGLGVVGLALLGAAGGSDEEGFRGPDQEAAKAQEELNVLTESWPKFSNPQEALNVSTNALRSNGINIRDGVSIEVGQVKPGTGGNYDYNNNKMVISSDVAKMLEQGNPAALHVVTHELAHSAQVVSPDNVWGDGNEALQHSDMNNFLSHLEGQNDLATVMAMSTMYGRPVTQSDIVDMANDFDSLNRRANLIKDGSTVVRIVGAESKLKLIGYEEESKTAAGIVKALSNQTGNPPAQTLSTIHDNGMWAIKQHEYLTQAFPGDPNLFISVNGQSFPIIPDQATLRRMINSNNIDYSAEFIQLLEEAARRQ